MGAYTCDGRLGEYRKWCKYATLRLCPCLSRLDTATWRNSQDAVLNSRTYAYGAYDIRASRQENPDGTVTVYSYNRSGDSETTTTESGVFSGNTLTLGTRQVSVSNGNGVNVSNESWFIDTANNVNVKTASTVNSNFDEFGRALTTTYLDGSTVTRTYGCCGVESEIDQNGTLTTYAYDEFKRLESYPNLHMHHMPY